MRQVLKIFLFLLGLTLAGPVFAEDNATPEEAVALVKKAVEFYKTQGREQAFAAFRSADGGFQLKDLYIFVQDMNGIMLSHGKNPGLIGKDLSTLKDADGKEFVAEMVNAAKAGKSGWCDYKWVNPATRKIQAKSSYYEPVGDVFIGAGIYK